MASLAMSRSLALPWSNAYQPSRSSTASPSSAGMRSIASQSQSLAPVQRDLARLDLPHAFRPASAPLKTIDEAGIDSIDMPQEPVAASYVALPTTTANASVASKASPNSSRPVSPVPKGASDESYKGSKYTHELREGDSTEAERLSPLSRLSRLWPREPTASSPTTQLLPPRSAWSTTTEKPDETFTSAMSSGTKPSSPIESGSHGKHRPAPLQLGRGLSASAPRRPSQHDILEERCDSFTFHLPSDLGLDSPSPLPNQRGPFGSSALLHSPQPRRPSLVLASEHAGLDEPPYTPCWGLQPLGPPERPQQAAAQEAHPTPSNLGRATSAVHAYQYHTHSVPPAHSGRYGGSVELEAIFRPKTTADDAVSAQPHQAGLATVTLSPINASEASSGNSLRPGDLERIAKLHNGRVPSGQQLAPPEHLCPAKYDPIINTGNQGPMVVQAGDWRCGVCNFVVSRRSEPRLGLLKIRSFTSDSRN